MDTRSNIDTPGIVADFFVDTTAGHRAQGPGLRPVRQPGLRGPVRAQGRRGARRAARDARRDLVRRAVPALAQRQPRRAADRPSGCSTAPTSPTTCRVSSCSPATSRPPRRRRPIASVADQTARPGGVPMIVDSHVYCFTAPDTLAGHPTVAGPPRPLAVGLRRPPPAGLPHARPGARRREPPARGRRPGRPCSWRATGRSASTTTRERLVWTVDGEDYTKVFLPPNTLAYSPGNLIAEMDYAGIDWALIHVDAALSKDVEYFAGLRPRLPGPAPVDGPGGRVADRDRAGRRHRRGDRRDRGPRPARVQDHPRVRLPVRAGPEPSTSRRGGRSGTRSTTLDVPIFFTLGAAARGRRRPPGLPRRALDGRAAGWTATPTPR